MSHSIPAPEADHPVQPLVKGSSGSAKERGALHSGGGDDVGKSASSQPEADGEKASGGGAIDDSSGEGRVLIGEEPKLEKKQSGSDDSALKLDGDHSARENDGEAAQDRSGPSLEIESDIEV
jgi:hypothetical protein